MARLTLTVQSYDPTRGAVADVEGGSLLVDIDNDEIALVGDAAGLRDLARWCLALADPAAPDGSHVHLDPNITPLVEDTYPLRIERRDSLAEA